MPKFVDRFLDGGKLKIDKKSSHVDSGPFWVVIGCNGCLLSSNVVIDIAEGSGEITNKTDSRFYDKEEAFEFAKTLALKTPGESYYVLESVAHVVIAPAQAEINPYW